MADARLIPTQETMKRCPRCGLTKPRDVAFYVSPMGRRSSWCRECDAIYRADYYERHRDAIRERRGPYAREYERRRKQEDPEYRLKSIAAVRRWWSGLSRDEQQRLNRRKKLLKRYGISIEDWESMVRAQSGKCAICRVSPNNSRDFHVDHDHVTGRVRGLLCIRCNTSLAWFERVGGNLGCISDYLAGKIHSA